MGAFDDPRGRQAEELSFDAERAAKRGDAGLARDLYLSAAELETAVARDVPADAPRVRAVLAVSAVALWLKAGRYRECEDLAADFLREPDVERLAGDELREIVAQCRNAPVVARLLSRLPPLHGYQRSTRAAPFFAFERPSAKHG